MNRKHCETDQQVVFWKKRNNTAGGVRMTGMEREKTLRESGEKRRGVILVIARVYGRDNRIGRREEYCKFDGRL